MNFDNVLNLSFAKKYRYPLFMQPRYMPLSAWTGHIPFSFFIMAMLRPKKIVELGTYLGASYFSFCQSVSEFKINNCKCYAIDTWEGDEHAGKYDDSVYNRVKDVNREYSDFSSLLRTDFDSASESDDLNGIDLLHIDGLHTYEAVTNDFNRWSKKMSDRGVILFHDTSEIKDGFGVWRFWDEISIKYPSFNLTHSHGLGVLCYGDNVKDELVKFSNDKNFDMYEHLFYLLGQSI